MFTQIFAPSKPAGMALDLTTCRGAVSGMPANVSVRASNAEGLLLGR
jgi:hypothetical protein